MRSPRWKQPERSLRPRDPRPHAAICQAHFPVKGDPEELKDVVKRLIRNGLEAMPHGGDLYISAEENAGFAHVYIQDSGASIPEPILHRIMDPFFTTKGKDADGLGLCIARAVLKRHQGDFRCPAERTTARP